MQNGSLAKEVTANQSEFTNLKNVEELIQKF